jgi:hypothetical protein
MARLTGPWWAALFVLVVNDHVLKGAGVLPGWLTGKLSDFAGLIVAPVLAAWIARARTPRVRALAFAAVVASFCAIKLSPAAASAAVRAVGWLGIPWRLWCDPTDLIALGVLPVAWRIAPRAAPHAPISPRRGRGAVPVILGAAACLATSKAGPIGFHTSAFLMNMTVQTVEVRVLRARGPLDCAQVASDPTAALASTFEPDRCARLEPGRVAPLDRNWWALDAAPDGGVSTAIDPPCDAVIIRVTDLPDTLLTWQQPGYVDVNDSPHDTSAGDALDPHGIYLERAGDRIYAAGSALIASRPATIVLPDVICADFPDADAGTDR